MTREQQQRTKIKICGLKRPEDITYVNEAKPDYCGFIIEFPKSSRNVTGALVRELTSLFYLLKSLLRLIFLLLLLQL